MRQVQETLVVETKGMDLYDITAKVCSWVGSQGIETGLLTVYCRHTSASLTIQENADPAVLHDLKNFFSHLVPESDQLYRHSQEGPDDMPAHIRSCLGDVSLQVPVSHFCPLFGTWQALYLFEHRRAPHQREVVLHLYGDGGF